MKNLFRPCIDIHAGRVKQIVGASLKNKKSDASGKTARRENFSSLKPASYFAKLFQEKGLSGGHIIVLDAKKDVANTLNSLNPSEKAAAQALESFPGGFHIGGGITLDNAEFWLKSGAAKVIITSALFNNRGEFLKQKLGEFSRNLGKESLVIDISAKPRPGHNKEYQVMADSWSLGTNLYLNQDTLGLLSEHASLLMAHAVELEGLKKGIDTNLLALLAQCPSLSLYCGGISSLQDIELIKDIGRKRVSFTVGSALSIYGGQLSLDAVIESGK